VNFCVQGWIVCSTTGQIMLLLVFSQFLFLFRLCTDNPINIVKNWDWKVSDL